jgi:hypothetical protein
MHVVVTDDDDDDDDDDCIIFKRQIKSRLPFAGIIRSSPYSTRFQNKS